MRVLVTGGAGFIGSHVADAFLARGDEVVVADDLSTGHEENIPRGATFDDTDVADGNDVERLFGSFRPELVCHLAAQASVTASVADPDHDFDVNVQGTFYVCEFARRHNSPIVFASTGGALYGDGAPLPTPEGSPLQPLSPYGASKLAGEAYVTTWGRLHGLPNVALRLGNVYGPRQRAHGEAGVVAIFSERLQRGEQPPLRGEGAPTRDYVFVRDVARAFVAAADAKHAGTYNVGTGRQTSTAELLELLQDAVGTTLEPKHVPLEPGELQASALDAGLIERELGWRPTVPLADGLRETVAWYAARAAP